MSEKRKAGLLMSFLMSAVMIIFMCSVNKFQVSGFSRESLFEILIHYPLEIIFVMAVSDLAANPLVDRLMKRFAGEELSGRGRILFRTLFLTTVMSMIMTLCGPLIGRIGGDFTGEFAGYSSFVVWGFATWINRWRMNFTMALFWNLICAGPFCRWVLRKYEEKKFS